MFDHRVFHTDLQGGPEVGRYRAWIDFSGDSIPSHKDSRAMPGGFQWYSGLQGLYLARFPNWFADSSHGGWSKPGYFTHVCGIGYEGGELYSDLSTRQKTTNTPHLIMTRNMIEQFTAW